MKVKRILVPVDFTPGPHDAIRYARAIANEFGSSIHVLHAASGSCATDWAKELCDSEAASVTAFGSLHATYQLSAFVVSERLDPFRTTALVRVGRPDDVIIRYAEEIGADLIVVGLHGDHNVPTAGMGLVVQRVLSHAPCAVLAIPERTVGVRELAEGGASWNLWRADVTDSAWKVSELNGEGLVPALWRYAASAVGPAAICWSA